MNFEGYDALTLNAGEYEILMTLHRFSEVYKVEYGVAARDTWVSDYFTDHLSNSVHIPKEILAMNDVSLYHSHTNETLLSVQDLRLLLNPRISKIAVITPDCNICAASVKTGYRPDETEFTCISNRIQAEAGMELFDRFSFDGLSILERNALAINECAYRIARYFEWKIEGGGL